MKKYYVRKWIKKRRRTDTDVICDDAESAEWEIRIQYKSRSKFLPLTTFLVTWRDIENSGVLQSSRILPVKFQVHSFNNGSTVCFELWRHQLSFDSSIPSPVWVAVFSEIWAPQYPRVWSRCCEAPWWAPVRDAACWGTPGSTAPRFRTNCRPWFCLCWPDGRRPSSACTDSPADLHQSTMSR